jgi:hypothetical protein
MELMQNINSMIMMKFGMRALHQPLKNPYPLYLITKKRERRKNYSSLYKRSVDV